MKRRNSNSCLLFYVLLLYTCTIGVAAPTEAATQFIYYNGSISGQFFQPDSTPSNCPDWYLETMQNAALTVGVNPPWDTNPFYFDFRHHGNTIYGCGMLISCTNDSIYNLYFSTADYVCFKDGKPCGLLEISPFYYEALELINLNEATVTPLMIEGGEKGYSVVGDRSTFVSNGTSVNKFDFERPMNYSHSPGCVGDSDELHFQW